MGVLNHPIIAQLDIHDKVVEKVVMGGASTKDRCFTPHHNIEITQPHLGNIQGISRMI